MMRLELAKTLFGRRALPVWLFASAPIFVSVLHTMLIVLWTPAAERPAGGELAQQFALVYAFILRGVVYLTCVWVFMNLFRGEIIDRSLHFYFLSPLRREVLIAGKFLAGWIGTTVVLTASTLLSFVLLGSYRGIGASLGYVFGPVGLGQALAYAGITALACLGYGAVFLLVGLYFRNPILPALIFFLIESVNSFLPSLLKKFSVFFYLWSLLPIVPAGSEGPFALLADPVSPWIAAPGLIAFAGLAVLAAGWRVRRMEIGYATEP
jgi:ABC-type transport system involved in multi-copper enzyme maturation permease subunit